MVSAGLLAAVLATAPCTHVTLTAQIDADLGYARGTIRCDVARSGPLAVATYPRVLTSTAGLDDINRFWFYPDGFDPAAMRLRLGGQPLHGSGPWQRLGHYAPGASVVLHFVTRIPERNGTFGRRRDILYLLGGWHPAFGDGKALAPMSITYRIEVPAGTVGFVGRTPFGHSSRRLRTGHFTGRFVPVLVAPGARITPAGDAVIVAPLHQRYRSRGDEPPWELRDVSASRDTTADAQLRRTLLDGAAFAARCGLPRRSLIVVRTPLREHLVESFDGGLAVSDRAFHLLPFEVFEKFHRLSVWREQLDALARPLAATRHGRLPAAVVADAVGSALRDRLAQQRYGGRQFAPDLLRYVDIIPEIDALIYAPQVPFADTYYRAIDERPRRRWRLDDFYNHLPRGKILYEKLHDEVGMTTAQQITTAFIRGRSSWLQVVRRHTSAAIARRVAAWLGPYPRVDYAIDAVHTIPSSTDPTVAVTVGATGPDAGHLREPIDVKVVDAHGHPHEEKTLGPGTVRFDHTPGPPRVVRLDPHHRLVELAHGPDTDPRFNDRRPPRWRFLLNNITGLIGATAGELTASIDFGLHRVHDLHWSWRFAGLYSATSVGLAAVTSYDFGRAITPLRLANEVGLGAAYERLRHAGPNVRPGDQGSVQLYYTYDDRLSPYWAFAGKGLSASLTGAYGVDTSQQAYLYWQAGISAFGILPLAFGQALLGRVRADVQFGAAPPQSGLWLGGRYRGGRGYERDEASSNRRIEVSGEYRHAWVTDARTDIFGLVTWNRIDGALFGDAIYLPVNRTGCHQSMFYDVGYGLRFFGDILNVAPATVQMDVGVPLNRCPDEVSRHLPVTIYVAFVQSFFDF